MGGTPRTREVSLVLGFPIGAIGLVVLILALVYRGSIT